MSPLTLGSLFDGIGVFPLAARQCGVTPLWASEISPNAISITKRHFPQMDHLGSITELSGKSVPPVDIPVHLYPAQEPGMAYFVAKTEDAPVINRICENMGLAPPMRTGPDEKAPAQPARGRCRPPKQEGDKPAKTPVREKVESAKAQVNGEKNAPSPAKAPKAKTPKPKAPTR